MTDTQSFLFDFTRVDNFIEQLNLTFKLSEMNTSNNFQLVFCSDSPNNIEDCLTSGGALNTSEVTTATNGVIDFSLKWERDAISIRNDVTWNIGANAVPLKSVFIRHKSSGYVMAYCIHISEFTVTNKIIFDAGTVLWRFIDE